MSNKDINIDDLFRNAFENFEVDPPEHVWGNIQKDMQGNNRGSGKTFPKGGILGISVILVLSSLFFIYQTNNSVSEVVDSAKIALNTDIDNIETLLPEYKSGENEKSNMASFNGQSLSEKGVIDISVSSINAESLGKRGTDAMIVKEKPIKEVAMEVNNNTALNPNNNELSSGNSSGEVENELDDIEGDEGQAGFGDDSDLLAMGGSGNVHSDVKASAPIPEESFEQTPIVEMLETEEADEIASGDVASPELKNDYGKKGDLYFGLYFTPEVIFYPSDINTTNKSYSLDLNMTYKFSSYLLQSGIGVMSSSDDGQSKVDFEKYLGSYEDVYDITFDTTANGVVPVYLTNTVDVYDSVQHVTVTPTKNKYTYLQIPVLFGYTEEFRRFSWFVKGGPSLSLMVNEDISSVNLENDNNRIVNVDSEVPARIKMNWQIILAGGVTYKLGNHVSIGVEPMMRFYMKSAYEQNSIQTKHPYSFGIRSGIIVNF
ncbi:MAG: PorT family protein [Chlorobi bacterium]|nr:PorT family protein [Chlorobiota bacterium]